MPHQRIEPAPVLRPSGFSVLCSTHWATTLRFNHNYGLSPLLIHFRLLSPALSLTPTPTPHPPPPGLLRLFFFLFFLSTSHERVKGFLSKCSVLKVDVLYDRQIYCLEACMCAPFSPEILQAGVEKGLITCYTDQSKQIFLCSLNVSVSDGLKGS